MKFFRATGVDWRPWLNRVLSVWMHARLAGMIRGAETMDYMKRRGEEGLGGPRPRWGELQRLEDEALGDEAFRGLAQDGLKTYRKQNAFMVFGTQSPADVLRSPIAHTILEQCATKIFLPNAHAAERDYIEGFGLTRREFALVREELAPESRQFLIKQGLNSVVAELRLDGLDDHLAVLSGRTETVDLLDRIRTRVGDDPKDWLELFHRERRMIL